MGRYCNVYFRTRHDIAGSCCSCYDIAVYVKPPCKNITPIMSQQRTQEIAEREQQKHLRELGIEFTVTMQPVKDKNGNEVIRDGKHLMRSVPTIQHVPELLLEVWALLDGKKECWFGGCESLLDQYKADVDVASAETGCTPCKKRSIKKKYEVKLLALAKKHKNESTTNKSPGGLSGPSVQNEERASTCSILLRRAAGYFKKIFSLMCGKK